MGTTAVEVTGELILEALGFDRNNVELLSVLPSASTPGKVFQLVISGPVVPQAKRCLATVHKERAHITLEPIKETRS